VSHILGKKFQLLQLS